MTSPVKKLEVRLTRAHNDTLLVGTLAEQELRIYFEYAQSFIERGFSLSPFRLPFAATIYQHTHLNFGPLPGLFDDSLPDGWGLLLMDRHFRTLGRSPTATSPLDRLAWLGTCTMGALTYHPPTERNGASADMLSLHDLAANARTILAGSSGEILPQLLRAGGSPGGARPKVLVGYDKHSDTVVSGESTLPRNFEHWLVKFTGCDDTPSAGAIEYAYSLMARAAGVEIPETRLFETKKGDRFFAVKRFDRCAKRRCHVHTFGNLIESNFRIPSCDYRDLLKVTAVLTRNDRDLLKVFRLMVFNVLTHNRDDHVKNCAFVMDDHGCWSFAPAYDLTYANGPSGEHSMTVAGEGRQPTTAHMLQLADEASIPRPTASVIVEEVRAAVSHWSDAARQADCQTAFPTLDTINV